MARMRATSIPTLPKRAVKIKSRKTFAKLLNGPTQPFFSAAAAASGQVESVTKGGEVLLK